MVGVRRPELEPCPEPLSLSSTRAVDSIEWLTDELYVVAEVVYSVLAAEAAAARPDCFDLFDDDDSLFSTTLAISTPAAAERSSILVLLRAEENSLYSEGLSPPPPPKRKLFCL